MATRTARHCYQFKKVIATSGVPQATQPTRPEIRSEPLEIHSETFSQEIQDIVSALELETAKVIMNADKIYTQTKKSESIDESISELSELIDKFKDPAYVKKLKALEFLAKLNEIKNKANQFLADLSVGKFAASKLDTKTQNAVSAVLRKLAMLPIGWDSFFMTICTQLDQLSHSAAPTCYILLTILLKRNQQPLKLETCQKILAACDKIFQNQTNNDSAPLLALPITINRKNQTSIFQKAGAALSLAKWINQKPGNIQNNVLFIESLANLTKKPSDIPNRSGLISELQKTQPTDAHYTEFQKILSNLNNKSCCTIQ